MVVCDNGSGLVRHRNLVSSWYTIYVYLYMCMYLQQANACTRYMYVYKFVQLIKKGEITNYQVKVKFYFESGRIRDLFSEVNSHKN